MEFLLPLDFAPMEAASVDAIPTEPGWQYEPKWDGFRCLAFRAGRKVELRSKAGQPLGRYFPEIVAAVGALKARRFVLDGEIVIPAGEGLSFDALLQRIHPAESRVRRLATETPAWLVVFDLLGEGESRWRIGRSRSAGSACRNLPRRILRRGEACGFRRRRRRSRPRGVGFGASGRASMA